MLLVATDPAFEHHDTGPGHPERARRLTAALRGPEVADLKDAVRLLEPREATAAELGRVHPPDYLEALERFCAAGGGDIDADTRKKLTAFLGEGDPKDAAWEQRVRETAHALMTLPEYTLA